MKNKSVLVAILITAFFFTYNLDNKHFFGSLMWGIYFLMFINLLTYYSLMDKIKSLKGVKT